MKIDRLSLVNWGQLRPADYGWGDLTLLTGETGSGKSTMLDGLQTVMTAAYPGILNYNPGQNEVTQGQRRGKTKRSLESYVVGAEYSKFSRPEGAQGFMSAVFRPSKGEEHLKPFTALIAASALVDGTGNTRQAHLQHMAMAIVDDAALSYADFMLDVEAGECVEVSHIIQHLKAKYSRVQDFHDKKRDYLCGLYGRFRGKTGVTWDEAQHAAKAWVQSIAYQPIGSVHDLVRNEILNFDSKQLQQDIERIRGLMRQVTNLRQEGERLEKNVGRLGILQTAINKTTTTYEQHVVQDMLVARLRLKMDEETIAAKTRKIKTTRETVHQEKTKISSWGLRVDGLDKSRINLAARLQGIPANAKKQDLDKRLADATATARMTLATLTDSLAAAGTLEECAKALIARSVPAALPKLNAAVSAVARALGQTELPRMAEYREAVRAAGADAELNVERLFDLVQAFSGTNTGITRVYETLVGSDESVSLAVAAETATLDKEIADARGTVRELGRQKALLAAGQVDYPREVRRALDLLREQYGQANVQVLCDLVDPKSDEWQPAIEGYMGAARFHLIVDSQWEAPALEFIRSKSLMATVVQGEFCVKNAAGKVLQQGSIVHDLSSANPVAWAYLVEQFGSVIKVSDADSEVLRFTSRGITLKGRGAGARTLYTCAVKEQVFGRKAREAALLRVTAELKIAEGEVSRLSRLKDELDAVKQLVQGIREPHFDALPLRTAAADISEARAALARLDLTELTDITEELNRVIAEIGQFNTNIKAAEVNLVNLGNTITSAENAIKAVEANKLARLDALDQQIARMKHLVETNPQLTYTVLAAQVEDALTLGAADSAREALETDKADAHAKREERWLGAVREALLEYNGQAKADERFADALPHLSEEAAFDQYYAPLVVLARTVSDTLESLRGIGLYTNRAELHEAEKSFHDVFTKQFCVEIKSKVDEGISTLRLMNKELENLKFGSDCFSIDWSTWEPEFQDYLSFFDAVTRLAESPETVDLFGETELSPKHIEVRDRLTKLLLDADQERATKELLRIADYRNYRRYDIWNNSESGGPIRLSEWGTGSGGQLETPAYIVRAAVVTNRLKLFEKGPSLKVLVSDESFAKMDEPRARAVLAFLRDNLDLQVISAMPTMKAGALKDEFNREYSFTRMGPVQHGELDFMFECDERIFKTDKMRELWARQRADVRQKTRQLFDEIEPEPAVEPPSGVEASLAGAIPTAETVAQAAPAATPGTEAL